MSELNLPICPRTKELHDWKIFLEDGGFEIRCDYCGEKHYDDEAIEIILDSLEALLEARDEVERLEKVVAEKQKIIHKYKVRF